LLFSHLVVPYKPILESIELVSLILHITVQLRL
jgi:hypothetical protein